MPFEIVRNDITKMKADAIVNAANRSLLGGGGVDGAIHRAAGPELLEECRRLGGCETGKAKITRGYRLPCRYVIHTVGPVWQDGKHGEEKLLASCYTESLKLAAEHGCETVAFPLISSGAYGCPKDIALKTATAAILDFLSDHDMHVSLVIYDRNAYLISQKLYANIQAFIDDSAIPPEHLYLQSERRRQYSQVPDFAAKNEAQDWPMEACKAPEAYEAPMAAPAPKAAKASKPGRDADSSGLEKYIARMDEGFREMLLRKIDERQMTDAECYKRANVDRKLFNKIKNQPDYRPGKTTVLALAIALRLPLSEIREMLEKAGYSLSHSSKGDMIVEYFILQGDYDIFDINEALFSFDQKLLGSMSV